MKKKKLPNFKTSEEAATLLGITHSLKDYIHELGTLLDDVFVLSPGLRAEDS